MAGEVVNMNILDINKQCGNLKRKRFKILLLSKM